MADALKSVTAPKPLNARWREVTPGEWRATLLDRFTITLVFSSTPDGPGWTFYVSDAAEDIRRNGIFCGASLEAAKRSGEQALRRLLEWKGATYGLALNVLMRELAEEAHD
jgi:hypothetical protein